MILGQRWAYFPSAFSSHLWPWGGSKSGESQHQDRVRKTERHGVPEAITGPLDQVCLKPTFPLDSTLTCPNKFFLLLQPFLIAVEGTRGWVGALLNLDSLNFLLSSELQCQSVKQPQREKPSTCHALNSCGRSEPYGELWQISGQWNDNLWGWDSGDGIFKNSPSDSKGQPRLKTSGQSKNLVLSIW